MKAEMSDRYQYICSWCKRSEYFTDTRYLQMEDELSEVLGKNQWVRFKNWNETNQKEVFCVMFVTKNNFFDARSIKPVCDVLRKYGLIFKRENQLDYDSIYYKEMDREYQQEEIKLDNEKYESLAGTMFEGEIDVDDEPVSIRRKIYLDNNGLYVNYKCSKYYLTADDLETMM